MKVTFRKRAVSLVLALLLTVLSLPVGTLELFAASSSEVTVKTYDQLKSALEGAKAGLTVIITADITVPAGKTLSIPTGVRLALAHNSSGAYGSNQAEDYVTSKSDSRYSVDFSTDDPVYTLTVKEGATLNVYGALNIGGMLTSASSSAIQGNTGSVYSLLKLDGNMNIVGGELRVYGYVVGEGHINAKASSDVYAPFVISGFGGGGMTYGLGMIQVDSPVTQYNIPNIQTGITIAYSAEFYAMGSLSCMNEANVFESKLVGISDALITLDSADAYVESEYIESDGSLLGKSSVTVYGDAHAEAFNLEIFYKKVSTADAIFPVSYGFDLTFKNGTFTVSNRYSVLPGARVTVDKSANVLIKKGGGLYISSGAVDYDLNLGNGKYSHYPTADVLSESGYEQRGVLDIQGGLVVEDGGIFAGIVEGGGNGSKIQLSSGAITSGSYNLGIAASYNINFTDYAYYNKTSYSLKAQALGIDGVLFDLQAGKTYYSANPGDSLYVSEFSYTYYGSSAGAKKQQLTGTISTYVNGSFAEKGVIYNYPDGTVEKSDDTVNLKAPAEGNYWYDAYTGLLVQSFKNSEAFYMLKSVSSAIKVNTGDETLYIAAVGGVIPEYTLEKDHYIFKGYSEKDDGSAEYQAGDAVPEGITELYAVWEACEYTVRYVLDKENYNIYGSAYLYRDGDLYVIYEKTYKYLDTLDLSLGVASMEVEEKYFEWNSEGKKQATENADVYGVYFEYGVRNLRTGVIHTSLATAIQYAENGDTLRLQSDTCESMSVPAGKEITIDLGSSKLYYEGSSTIKNSGKLTVTSSTGGGSITQTGNGASSANVFYAVENLEDGEFILEGGSLITESTSQYTRTVTNKGTFIINGGSISSKTGYAIYNYGASAKLVQNLGDVTFAGTSASNYGVYNYNKAEYTMNGGSIAATSGGRAFYNYLKSTFNVNGGMIQSRGGTVFNNGSTMNVRGGIIKTTASSSTVYAIQNTKQSSNLGTLNVYGGSIVATSGARGIYNYNSVLNVYGGYIATEGNSTSAWGVYNYYLSTMNVYGGKIYSKKSHGVYNYSASKTNIPTANFYGGEVETDSTASYYPVMNGASTKYGNVNIEGGSFISASTYAVYSGNASYKINVKEGALGGIYGYKTAALYNFTNNTGKTLEYRPLTTGSHSGAYCLADASAAKNITCDGVAYSYIAEALASAVSGSVITLNADTKVNHPETLVSGVTVNLNGKVLDIGANTITVTEAAYLTDGLGGGGISVTEGVAIYEGILEFADTVNGKKVIGYSADGGTDFYKSVPDDADFVIYPVFEDTAKFTVVFKDLDGSVIAEYILSYNEVIPTPKDPAIESDGRYKYTFTGWSPKVEDLCTANREYTAQYNIEEIKYSVIFKDINGEIVSASAYVWEETITAPEAPYLTSDSEYYYTFIGWYDESGAEFDWERVYSDGEFTAKYEANALKNESITTGVGFNSATVVMESSMVINFRVKSADFEGYDKLYAEFVREYSDNREDETVIVEDYTVNGDYLVFPLTGIAAKEMNDNVKATFYGVKGDTKYVYKSLDYSIVTYAMNNLEKSTTTKAYKTLLVDMLNYGSMAQIHLGYNTDNLANAGLTDTQKAYGSYSGGEMEFNSVRNYNRLDEEQVSFRSASIVFADKVLIKYQLNFTNYTGNKENVSVLVKYVDVNGVEHNKLVNFNEMEQNGNYYTFEFTEVAVKDMGMSVEAAIYEDYESLDRVQLSGVLTYSVESYAASKQTSSEKTLVDLVNYMIAYSRSADKYFSK